MFQNKEKIFGIGTTPKLLGGMAFFVPLDVILIKSEVRSTLPQVNSSAGTVLTVELFEEQEQMIQQKEDKIKELQQQLSDYEYEIYGLDLQNYYLQKLSNPEDQNIFTTRIQTGEN
jgi:hypothetical protein